MESWTKDYLHRGLTVISVSVSWVAVNEKKQVTQRVAGWQKLRPETCAVKLDPKCNAVGIVSGEQSQKDSDLIVVDVDAPAMSVWTG